MVATFEQRDVPHAHSGAMRKFLLRQAFCKTLMSQRFCKCVEKGIV